MAEDSKIGWTDNTQNFWMGCAKIHEGCKNCYAEEMMDNRFSKVNWGRNTPRVVTTQKNWNQAKKWNEQSDPDNPTVVFTNSLADFFENNTEQCQNHKKEPLFIDDRNNWVTTVPDPSQATPLQLMHVRMEAMKMIKELTNLRWVILTKRPVDVPAMWPYRYVECSRCKGKGTFLQAVPAKDGKAQPAEEKDCICNHDRRGWMREMMILPHVWVCISISTQAHYDQLMDGQFRMAIEQTRGVCGGMGLSIEPQLDKIVLDIQKYAIGSNNKFDEAVYPFNWIKVGGESGPHARVFDYQWAKSLKRECDPFESIRFFMKQGGHNAVNKGFTYKHPAHDPKGEDFATMPCARLRQSPFKQEVRDPTEILDSEFAE